jgi:hypothetical protein
MVDRSRQLEGPARVVLEGVPRIGFVQDGPRCQEDVPFPSALRACLEYMDESFGCRRLGLRRPACQFDCAYAYFMGTSGYAFQLSWKPGWHRDGGKRLRLSADPAAPFHRAFEAAGHAHEIILVTDAQEDEARFRQRIVESIREQGRPVLGFGVVGPPECCIIAGYDEYGDVLIGWSFFQDSPPYNTGVEFEPSGYFRKRDWFRDTEGLICIGAKKKTPPRREIYAGALDWALHVVRTPVVEDNRHSGLAAYTAWAEALKCDADFRGQDETTLWDRFLIHDDAVGAVAEGRWYAAQFLRQMAEHTPTVATPLLAAAACYEAEHDLMWEVWALVGGNGRSEAHAHSLADPTVRRQIASLVLQARDLDVQAAGHMERALALWA